MCNDVTILYSYIPYNYHNRTSCMYITISFRLLSHIGTEILIIPNNGWMYKLTGLPFPKYVVCMLIYIWRRRDDEAKKNTFAFESMFIAKICDICYLCAAKITLPWKPINIKIYEKLWKLAGFVIICINKRDTILSCTTGYYMYDLICRIEQGPGLTYMQMKATAFF